MGRRAGESGIDVLGWIVNGGLATPGWGKVQHKNAGGGIIAERGSTSVAKGQEVDLGIVFESRVHIWAQLYIEGKKLPIQATLPLSMKDSSPL